MQGASDESVRKDGKRYVGSVVQAVSVLRHLGRVPDGAGVTAIASALGISPSSCFNILKTLVAEEFLEFDARRKTYRLGLGAVDLARQALGVSNLYPTLRRGLADLSERYDMVVGLWRLSSENRLVLVGVAESEQSTRIHMSIGQRVPIFAGAIGCCAAAAGKYSQREIARGIESVRWEIKPTLDDYLQHIKQTRERGWAIDAGQWRRGVMTVAAPILDNDGEFRFGITASMFDKQHDRKIVRSIGADVLELAHYAARRAFGSVPRLSDDPIPAANAG